MPEPTTPLSERPWESVERMLDVDAALELVLASFGPLSPESMPLMNAAGLVLSDDVVARDSVPPFRNSAMDGFAIRCADVAGADWERPVELPVAAQVAAGDAVVPPLPDGHAIRIMTGAPLPAGADAVVRFEETDAAHHPGGSRRSTVRVFRPPRMHDNVREAGEDIRSGTVVGHRGQVLTPPDLGLFASVGLPAVSVHRRPRVGILSTGDEVIVPGQPLSPGKIRDSNAFVLGALARRWGAEVRLHGVARDSVDDLTGRLSDARDADLIVTSGGVSLGDFDFVKDVLKAEGSVDIWQVRMKPGKPLAFGHVGGRPLLGVPGNPVAAAVSFMLFGRPAILRMLGYTSLKPPTIEVLAGEEIDNRGHRRHFVRARLEASASGLPRAYIVGDQGAGVLTSLAAADALLIVPEERELVTPGMKLQAIRLDWRREI